MHTRKTSVSLYLSTLALLIAPSLGLGQTITTVAGNGNAGSSGDGGPAKSAALQPNGVTVDHAGNIYIADFATSVIRKVSTAGIISTVAGYASEPMQFTGDGVPAAQSSIYILERHTGLAVDAAGNLYIADTGHDRIRKVDKAGMITTVAGHGSSFPFFAGDDGPATQATLFQPTGLALDGAGNLYIADTNSSRLRRATGVAGTRQAACQGAASTPGTRGATSTGVSSPPGPRLFAGHVFAQAPQTEVPATKPAGPLVSPVRAGPHGLEHQAGTVVGAGDRGYRLDAGQNLADTSAVTLLMLDI